MRELDIKDIRVTYPCKEGAVVFIGNGEYAIHYNVTLAIKRAGTLYLNANYVNRFSQSDLKTIRGIDDTFKKRGEKFLSDLYEIEIVEFIKGA